jgi:hypothetical protein
MQRKGRSHPKLGVNPKKVDKEVGGPWAAVRSTGWKGGHVVCGGGCS